MKGSISKLFPMVLPLDTGPMLSLKKPSNPYFLPPVEHTIVGLPHPFGKLLQGEFGLLQADSRLTLCTAQARRIVALFICTIMVVGNLRQWGQVRNLCDIRFPQFRGWQKSSHWEVDGRSPRCAGRRSRLRS